MENQDAVAASANVLSDRKMEQRYWFWMALHALIAAPALAALGPTVLALKAAGIPDVAALVLGFMGISLVLAIGALIAWLQTHHWLGWLFRDIRSRALVGAERLARDDDELMLEGIREVVFEWRHIDDVLRERHWSAVILALATGFVLILLVLLSPWLTQGMLHLNVLPTVTPIWAVAAYGALAFLHSASGFALSWSVYRSKCFSEGEYDPTRVIQERVLALLTEVKALRRTGVFT